MTTDATPWVRAYAPALAAHLNAGDWDVTVDFVAKFLAEESASLLALLGGPCEAYANQANLGAWEQLLLNKECEDAGGFYFVNAPDFVAQVRE